MLGNRLSVFRFDEVEDREREFTLIKAGKVLTVEPKAFRALLFLLHNSQRLITKEELLNSVWGDAAVTEGSLTRCIWLLRSVLGDDIRSPRYIETVATVGYRFVCKVEVSEDVSGELEAMEAPNDLSGAGKRVGSRKRLRGWALGGGALALCMAVVFWYLRRPARPAFPDGMPPIRYGSAGSQGVQPRLPIPLAIQNRSKPRTLPACQSDHARPSVQQLLPGPRSSPDSDYWHVSLGRAAATDAEEDFSCWCKALLLRF